MTAYPYARPPDRPLPCAEVLAGWPPSDRAALLNAAGEERLRLKTLRIAAAIRERGAPQTFYEETMAAFGYKHNRAAFRLLARKVSLAALAERTLC